MLALQAVTPADLVQAVPHVSLAEARKIGIVIDPISGEELQALAEKIYTTPAAIVEQAKQAVMYKAP